MNVDKLRDWLKSAFRLTNVISGIALVAVIGSALFADAQNRALQQEEVRGTVGRQLGLLRARLEGNLIGNFQLVRGLIATLATEPHMDETRFAELSSGLFEQQSQLKDIAGAPDLKVSLVYPITGNEKVLGLDYTKNEAQRLAAFRARDTGSLVVAGPVDL